MPEPGLRAHFSVRLRHRIGSLDLSAEFHLDESWTVLFGPSGSGKTTILRVLAGLTRADQSRIEKNVLPGAPQGIAALLDDTATSTHLPAWRRGIGYAPQAPALFTHKTVGQNIGYGLKYVTRNPEERKEADALIHSVAEVLRVSGLAAKYPAELSGGEAQRVNLARALTTSLSMTPWETSLFLLDEPFTGLDVTLRDAIIGDLREWMLIRRVPVLSVTHDVAEAFLLNAEVIKLSEGRIVQQGPVATVLAEERARLLGQLSPLE